MNVHRAFTLTVLVALLVGLPLAADTRPTETVDLDAVYRIKEEGLQRSTVMEIESYLTDVYGPRLTGSPNIKEAADWAQKRMKDWGLANVHLETWPFGRGWQNQRFVALATLPRAYPLIGYPKAWTPGTNGPVTGEAVIALIQNEQDFDVYRGKLRGRFVLVDGDARSAAAISGARRAATLTPSSPTWRSSRLLAAAAAISRRPTPNWRESGRSSGLTKAWPRSSTSVAATAAPCSSRRRPASRASRTVRRSRPR